MTKEEAQHIVDVAFDVPLAVRRSGEDRTYHEGEIREAKNMAIKALEQESVLDKIRTEIMSKDGLDEALEIIDRYRAESEVQNEY